MLVQPCLVAVRETGQCWKYIGTEYGLDIPYAYTGKAGPLKAPLPISVPVGFICDGASSPRFAWSLIGFLPRGIHDPAALVHDFLYTCKGTTQYGHKFSRKDADSIFLGMLKQCGVKSWHAALAYGAVRAAGWYWWNKKSEQK